MDSVLLGNSQSGWREFAKSWRPRPNSGSLVKDALFVLFVVFLQTTIFPSVLGSFGNFDLVTPLIVVTAVRQKPLQVTLIAMLGAFALETKSAVPAGIYLCSYWIMINAFFQIRPALSWRYRTPWIASYALSVVWIGLFETFVLIFLHDTWSFSTSYIFQELVKLILALGVGMYFSKEWMRIDAEEPVPQ